MAGVAPMAYGTPPPSPLIEYSGSPRWLHTNNQKHVSKLIPRRNAKPSFSCEPAFAARGVMQKSTPEADSSACELDTFFDRISNEVQVCSTWQLRAAMTVRHIRTIYPMSKGCHFSFSYPLGHDLALAFLPSHHVQGSASMA